MRVRDPPDPKAFAFFFRYTPVLDKNMIGDYLGDPDEFQIQVLQEFTRTFEFAGMILDNALRTYLETFSKLDVLKNPDSPAANLSTLLCGLIPILQPCLNMLLAMLEAPMGEDMRDLLALARAVLDLTWMLKLTVTVPSPSDESSCFVSQRNMANVMSEMILASWSQLRPAPYPWGGKALQLLGKLGGCNRRFLKEPLALELQGEPRAWAALDSYF
ncbi:hypothetical protein Dsin_014251 [Dipteronia sinensis]|uniref:SEC7 domain-containing protein n=1 Tax=Dipteronia sinensis TaxID=43782 RepID=A0AAE0E9R8_9ROSI|nr:hypothetical protein Dsin_014251 [Dipteronia sinensis]